MAETVADIRNAEQERLAKAIRFDHLTNEYNGAARMVERLGAQSASQRHLNVLLRILEEARKLPDDVVHDAPTSSRRGGDLLGTIPGGLTGHMITAITESAVTRLRQLETQRAQQLDAAKLRRDTAKAALKDEFGE